MTRIIDLHCDALLKLEKNKDVKFENDHQLDVNLSALINGQVKAQAFAIFISPNESVETQFNTALNQIKRFKEDILTCKNIKHIKHWQDFNEINDDEVGVFLTLEGVGCIGNDLQKLECLIDEGVMVASLTWNTANLAADGIMEPRGGGLTQFGFQVIELLNKRSCLVDISHLSRAGVNQVIEHANYVIASHSNCFTLCSHPRNLLDNQILDLIKKEAMIHLVFCPQFVKETNPSIDDLMDHIDHIIDLGGKDLIGLGSDFDGIENKVKGLNDWNDGKTLIDKLELRYGKSYAKQICSGNFMNFIKKKGLV